MPNRRDERLTGSADVGNATPSDPTSGQRPAGTFTFLFTDLEGSASVWEEHPAAMGAALARHDAILREPVLVSGGAPRKTARDGRTAPAARPGNRGGRTPRRRGGPRARAP